MSAFIAPIRTFITPQASDSCNVIPFAWENPHSVAIHKTGEFPKTQFYVVYDYGHCERIFDGHKWTVYEYLKYAGPFQPKPSEDLEFVEVVSMAM